MSDQTGSRAEPDILLPPGETDPDSFQADIHEQVQRAIHEGRLRAGSRASLFDLAMQALLAEHEAALVAAEEIKLDLAVSGEASGWLERQKRRLRTAAHNVALFYVNRQARSQYRVNRQTSEILIALVRQATRAEQTQRELVGRLEAQVAALQAEVKVLRQDAGHGRHEN